jgi:hypothetical protein
VHLEHVVPCRVLMERMIKDSGECRALLEKAVVIARVTPEEHRRIGGLYPRHLDVYGRMLKAPVSLPTTWTGRRWGTAGREVLPTHRQDLLEWRQLNADTWESPPVVGGQEDLAGRGQQLLPAGDRRVTCRVRQRGLVVLEALGSFSRSSSCPSARGRRSSGR